MWPQYFPRRDPGIAVLLGIAILVAGPGTAPRPAFAMGSPPEPPWGTYLQTCKDVVHDAVWVRANCRNNAGAYVAASIDHRLCQLTDDYVPPKPYEKSYTPWRPYGIENVDGTLKCRPKSAHSYSRSCEYISWDASGLTAWCHPSESHAMGTWNRGFDYNKCLAKNVDIVNCEGTLLCARCPQEWINYVHQLRFFGGHVTMCKYYYPNDEARQRECIGPEPQPPRIDF